MVSVVLNKCPCGSNSPPLSGKFAFWFAVKCPDCDRRVEANSLEKVAVKWNELDADQTPVPD